MHGLTGGSWKRNTDRARATEMKDTRGNPAVTSGSETYRRSASPRQLSTLRAALDRVGGAGSSGPVALIVACGCDESPGVAPVGGLS